MEVFWTFVGSAIVAIGVIMGAIKKIWKPKMKGLYMVPAVILSLGAGGLAFLINEIQFVWYLWLGASALICGDQLFLQNEMWPAFTATYRKIRELVVEAITKMLKPKK